MADVEYTVAAKFQGDGELRAAANSFDNLSARAQNATSGMGSGMTSVIGKWTELNSILSLSKAAFGAIGTVAATAMQTLQEGAGLVAAREKFDNLAASINTTGDALLNAMRGATSGLMSDAELVESATSIMSLGLASTQEEAVRLGSVIGKLGWDMQQVVLTMANNSTMRLDALGLSMESVVSRSKELQAAGMSLDESFDLAVIEAGEAKIALLGDASDTTAGKIKQLEVSLQNAKDAFSAAFAEGLAEQMGAMAGSAGALGDSWSYAAAEAGRYAAAVAGFATRPLTQSGMRYELGELATQYKNLGGDMDAFSASYSHIFEMGARAPVEYLAAAVDALGAEVAELQKIRADAMATIVAGYIGNGEAEKAAVAQARAQAQATTIAGYLAQGQEYLARATTMVTGAQRDAAAADRDRAAAMADLAAKTEELAARAAEAWANYTSAAEAKGGGIFAGMLDDIEAAKAEGRAAGFDLMESIYAAMQQGGAGVNPLADMAAQIGASVEDIKAAVTATQEQTIVDSLAAAAIAGRVAWEDYAASVQKAIDILHSGAAVEDPKPVRVPVVPEMTETGDFQHLVGSQLNPVIVPTTLNLDEIRAAVDEARGIVNGFAGADQVYQAVIDLDIKAVEDGATAAKALIEGVPSQKTVTINFEQTGSDVLAALRALGVIP